MREYYVTRDIGTRYFDTQTGDEITVETLMDELARLQADCERLRALLAVNVGGTICPWCLRYINVKGDIGHAADCQRQRALGIGGE